MKVNLLSHNFKSYLIIFLCGLLAGVITRLTDFCSADTLWCFPSIATLFGFWIICVTVIVLLSNSALCAGLNSFLYLFGMTLSFYVLQYILGFYLPMFDNGSFKTSLFLLYSLLSAGCGIGAFILHFWERNTRLSAILYALPVGALLSETIGVTVCLATRAVFLFQFLMNGFAVILFGIMFYKRTNHKILYLTAICLVAAAVYYIVYQPFLSLV